MKFSSLFVRTSTFTKCIYNLHDGSLVIYSTLVLALGSVLFDSERKMAKLLMYMSNSPRIN